jgi:hypothetical protein
MNGVSHIVSLVSFRLLSLAKQNKKISRGSVAVSGTFPLPACLVGHSQGRHIHHD